jgi:chromosome partitioning protein
MRTIVIASPKGGTGKSTLTGHLAVEAETQGHGKVAIIDTDPQGSLASWWNAREADTPLFATVDITQLPGHLIALREHGINLVIIDTPPTLSATTHSTLAVADLVIIPVRPSPHDLRAIGTILEVVEQQDKPFIFVINAATPRSHIASDAVRALAQYGKVAPTTLHNRVDFAMAMIDGRTVGELDHKSRSAQEAADLWIYVNEQLNKSVRRNHAWRSASDHSSMPG